MLRQRLYTAMTQGGKYILVVSINRLKFADQRFLAEYFGFA